MKSKNISLLLINPPMFNLDFKEIINFHSAQFEPTLALPIIFNHLKKEGYNVTYCDFSLDDIFKSKRKTWSKILKTKEKIKFQEHLRNNLEDGRLKKVIKKQLSKINLKKFDLIGFSIFSPEQLLTSLIFSRIIKNYDFRKKIIFGGAFVKHFYESLYKYEFIDYFAIGDGEITLSKLMNFLTNKLDNLEKIPSLIYRKQNEIIKTHRVEEPIDKQVVPIFDKKIIKFYKNKNQNNQFIIPYQLSKGCKDKCSFCVFCITEKIEFKNISKIITELSYLKKKYNPNLFHFVDSNINNDEIYLEKLCDEIINNNLNIKWYSFARPTLRKKLLIKMKKAGCIILQYGIETGSNKINKLMNKGFKIKEAEKCLCETNQIGIQAQVYFILGFPNEKLSDIQDSIGFYKRNRNFIDSICVFRFMLRKHTAIFNHPEKFGIKNIRLINKGIFSHSLAFDEISGLSWKKKIKQTNYFMNLFMKQIKISYIKLYSSRYFMISIL